MSRPNRVLDGDGHVIERDDELFEYLDAPYAGNTTLLGYPFFPALDGYNRGAYASRVMDRLTEAGRRVLDPAARSSIYARVQRLDEGTIEAEIPQSPARALMGRLERGLGGGSL